MRTLTVLLAHGSSDPAWGATFERMAAPVLERYPDVMLAYMELSNPTLDQVAEQAQDEGFGRLTVLPLFLAQGKHLKHDVPAMLKAIETRTGMQTTLLPPIGEHPALAGAIVAIIDETLSRNDRD
jgi:sirohydrochlorin cobaltochelatase